MTGTGKKVSKATKHATQDRSVEDISEYEKELKSMGFSDCEIEALNNQLDGIINRGFDKYFFKLYE